MFRSLLVNLLLTAAGIIAVVVWFWPHLVPLYDDIGPVAFIGLGVGMAAVFLLFYWLRARFRL